MTLAVKVALNPNTTNTANQLQNIYTVASEGYKHKPCTLSVASFSVNDFEKDINQKRMAEICDLYQFSHI